MCKLHKLMQGVCSRARAGESEAQGGVVLVYQSNWPQPRLHYRTSEETRHAETCRDLHMQIANAPGGSLD